MCTNKILGCVLEFSLVVGVIWAVYTTPLLRDPSAATKPPYSFSRSQLVWWLFIVATCFIAAYGFTGNLPEVNATALSLLGISAGTRAVASVLDQRQDQASDLSGIKRCQDMESGGWFFDVLADNTGVSVHRLQALVFNIIYGTVYLANFFSNPTHELPKYTPETLVLLGISATTYAFMKGTENQGQESQPAAAVAANDDSGWAG